MKRKRTTHRHRTDAETELLRELYPRTPWGEMEKLLGRSHDSIMHHARGIGIRRDTRHHWTPEDDELLRKLYPNVRSDVLASRLSTTLSSVYQRAHEVLGLCKSKEFLASPESGILTKGHTRGKATQFKKGHVPWDKGMRGLHLPGSEKGQFKKGHQPKNTKHDGASVIRRKRGGKPYRWIRVALGKWKQYHVYLWERVYGPVPKGNIIIFADDDTLNVTLENLRCITRAQHARNTQQRDGFIAKTMSHGKRRGEIDRELYHQLLRNPQLLELKRKQLQLRRMLHEKDQQV